MARHILVATDDPCTLILVEYNLVKVGHCVEHCERGDDLLGLLAHSEPDLLLLEWRLPGISGLEVCRRLRSSTARSKPSILIMSSTARHEDRDFAIGAGACDVLVKPFSLRDLTSSVERLTGGAAYPMLERA